MNKNKTAIISTIIIFSILLILKSDNINYVNESSSYKTDFNPLKISSTPVNGKSLLVNQHANISKSFSNVKSGDNVSFTLYDDWVSYNTTINYEGVAQKMDTITNGGFDSGDSGWNFKTNIPSTLSKLPWDSSRGYPDPDGCTGLDGSNSARSTGDYGYLEQNITLQNEELQNNMATFSFNYNSDWALGLNASLFMSVIIGGVEINKSVNVLNLPTDTWFTLIMNYNPVTSGQVLIGDITVRVGIIINEDSGPEWIQIFLDNFQYELWTETNDKGIIKTFDTQFSQNHTYYNTTFGEGYSFIDTERIPDLDRQIDFTVYNNRTGLSDFKISTVNVISYAVKKFNSTVSNSIGSLYTLGENISWEVEFSIIIHNNYDNWLFIEKPSDWKFIHAFDGFEDDVIDFCVGKGLGSKNMEIPTEKVNEGLWKLEAVSRNYISNGSLEVWNSISFVNTHKLNHGNLFRVSVSLNDSLLLSNTRINCSIYYPNASLFWHISREPTLHNEKFGNFSVGRNMTVGKYSVVINWVNNQSFFEIDRVGYEQFEFTIWHYTNITAVTSNFEQIAGDPLLLKVKFIDFDLNSSIHFATVTYSSTFGPSGTMIYIGSGEYFIDIDTNSLSSGDYYFSFNASKIFYENQTAINLIHLKIVEQPLALEVPHNALEGYANNIISCRINTTGAISGTLITDLVNVSTDWFNPYNVTNHFNGTYTLDFSTVDIPTNGFLESFNIEIFANKTNYGNTNEFITLLVHPLATVTELNTSLVSVNSNNIVNLKVNYTLEVSGEIITGSNCSVTWQSSYLITPVSDGFNIKLFTTGLAVDYYTALIKLEKIGYEDAFESVTVIIIEQDVNLTISINSEEKAENELVHSFFQQTINITARVYALIDEEFLSGGVFTLLSNNFQKNLTETPLTYFYTSLILDGANFISGINTVFLRFEQANYSTKIFPFQLFIRAQSINLSAQINYQEIHENYFFNHTFNSEFQISCRAFVDIEGVFLSSGSIAFVNGDYQVDLIETTDFWFNQTIQISTSSFTIGPNYVYLRFTHNNYSTTTFAFQVFVHQVEIDVDTLDFEGFISGAPGDIVLIRLNLTESRSSNYIENATVYYSWNFGAGYFTYIGNGIYEKELSLPSGIDGNYNLEIIISHEGVLYKTKEFAFFVEIEPEEGPNILIWIIIISLIAIISILGTLSLRSYVIIPKRREREAELLGKIQVYKDVWNIRAVVIIHRESGLPVYSREISIMEKDQDSFLISGFIQAITAFSESFVEKEFRSYSKLATEYEYLKSIIDLDFKFFQLVVCDHESVRVLVILREEASELLKKQLFSLAKAIDSQFGKEFKNFQGTLSHLEKPMDEYLNRFLFLHYNNSFEMTPNKNYFDSKIESSELTKLERRVINVIASMTKINRKFTLRAVIDLIDEKNEDIVLEALNTLIKEKLILSPYSPQLDQKKK